MADAWVPDAMGLLHTSSSLRRVAGVPSIQHLFGHYSNSLWRRQCAPMPGYKAAPGHPQIPLSGTRARAVCPCLAAVPGPGSSPPHRLCLHAFPRSISLQMAGGNCLLLLGHRWLQAVPARQLAWLGAWESREA